MYNQFLNKSLMASLPPKPGEKPVSQKKPRVPMAYVHTREIDAFYELSQSAELTLPGSIRAQLHSRQNRAKVRITRDQKTGKELAKIIKVRVADLDVYSPRTSFDWRVSVNLEMRYNGDSRDLKEVMEGGKKTPERNKDRVTYRHLAYQVDLTQVTMDEVSCPKRRRNIADRLREGVRPRRSMNLRSSCQLKRSANMESSYWMGRSMATKTWCVDSSITYGFLLGIADTRGSGRQDFEEALSQYLWSRFTSMIPRFSVFQIESHERCRMPLQLQTACPSRDDTLRASFQLPVPPK